MPLLSQKVLSLVNMPKEGKGRMRQTSLIWKTIGCHEIEGFCNIILIPKKGINLDQQVCSDLLVVILLFTVRATSNVLFSRAGHGQNYEAPMSAHGVG